MPERFSYPELVRPLPILILCSACAPLLAQYPAAAPQSPVTSPLAFEVASLKLVKRDTSHPGPAGAYRMTADPVRIRYSQASMRNLLTQAFEQQWDQFVAPEWAMDEDWPDRFEIDARTVPHTPMKDVHAMLLNLLIERFHLAYHGVRKDMDVYELVVAKGGPKLTDAEIPAELPRNPGPVSKGKDGYPVLSPGSPQAVGFAKNATLRMALTDEFVPVNERIGQFTGGLGLFRFSFRMVTIPQLLKALQGVTGLIHVVDHTNLQGKYDVRLAFALGGSESGREQGEASDPVPDIFSAFEKQLGLQFQKTKAPLDVIVIDRLDRTPVEN